MEIRTTSLYRRPEKSTNTRYLPPVLAMRITPFTGRVTRSLPKMTCITETHFQRPSLGSCTAAAPFSHALARARTCATAGHAAASTAPACEEQHPSKDSTASVSSAPRPHAEHRRPVLWPLLANRGNLACKPGTNSRTIRSSPSHRRRNRFHRNTTPYLDRHTRRHATPRRRLAGNRTDDHRGTELDREHRRSRLLRARTRRRQQVNIMTLSGDLKDGI